MEEISVSIKPQRYLYVFLDESGDFNFSPTGTKYFLLTSVTKERPFLAPKALHDLRYDLLQRHVHENDCFHATEDKQEVRDAVYEVIRSHLEGIWVDTLFVEKAKTDPPLREFDQFYPYVLGAHLRYVLQQQGVSAYDEVLIVIASLHTGKQKKAMEKAVKQTLKKMLPSTAKYRIVYHSAKSNFDVQIADYCAWAVYKKLTTGEERPHKVIQPVVRGEIDIFARGTTYHY